MLRNSDGKCAAFEGGVGEKRAFGTLNRSVALTIFIIMSLGYVKLSCFSADPTYYKPYINIDIFTDL